MKTSVRKRCAISRLGLAMLLCLTTFSPSLFPASAGAVPRKESAGPLLGDPTDTNDGPASGPSKASQMGATVVKRPLMQVSAAHAIRGEAAAIRRLLNRIRWFFLCGIRR